MDTRRVIASSAYQKITHVQYSLGPRDSPKKPLDLTHFQFENRSRTTCSRFLLSFALHDEAVQLQLSLENVGTSCEIVLLIFRRKTQVSRTICTSVPLLHQVLSQLCPSQAAFTIFQVLTLFSYSKHYQDHGMYTYTNTSLYAYTNTYTYSYAFTYICTCHNI